MGSDVSLLADRPFECDKNKTPLESALRLLEMITKRFSFPQSDCVNVLTSLKEMVSVSKIYFT